MIFQVSKRMQASINLSNQLQRPYILALLHFNTYILDKYSLFKFGNSP